MTTRGSQFILVAIFALLASWYTVITPYRTAGVLVFQRGAPAADIGAPDERQHANYVHFVREKRSLPILDPNDPNLYENYQSHQPPLYYALLSVLGDPVDPSTGKTLRFLNVLFGCGTILGLFALGRWTFGNDIAGLSVASIGLLPGFVTLHGSISNDPLLFLLMTWCMALLVRAIDVGWAERRWLLIGMIAGLAWITKTSSLALAPALLLGVFFSFRARNITVKQCLGAVAIALLIALPVWLRNLSVYGDPFAMKAFREAFTGTAQAGDFIAAFGPTGYWFDWVLWWTTRSALGAFGYMDIFMPSSYYQVLMAILFISPLGFFLFKNQGIEKPCGRLTSVQLVLLATVVVLFMQFNSIYFQGQARYIFPAIAALGVFFGAGTMGFHKKFAPWVLLGVLVCANLFCLSRLPAEFERRMVPAPQAQP